MNITWNTMKYVLIASILAFVIACSLPALEFSHNQTRNEAMIGANVLAVGWSGIFAGVFAWYANPLWAVGLLMAFLGKPKPALVLGVLSIALAANTFAAIGRELPADEGGVNHMTLVKLLPGCYAWMLSLLILPFCALFPGGVRAMK